jgi:thiol:disulfide interchange protein
MRTSASTLLIRTLFAPTAALALGLLTLGCNNKSMPQPDIQTAAAPQPQPAPLATPEIHPRHIYHYEANPTKDIAAAVTQARKQNKRIILDFGGDWCGDCQVLDLYFHQSPNAELLDQHFLLIHVDIGRYDHNTETAIKYKIPIDKGVPALAVLDSNGKLLFSQANKEFENMRNMTPQSVTAFLNQWKS